jgi:hypothetical protein
MMKRNHKSTRKQQFNIKSNLMQNKVEPISLPLIGSTLRIRSPILFDCFIFATSNLNSAKTVK